MTKKDTYLISRRGSWKNTVLNREDMYYHFQINYNIFFLLVFYVMYLLLIIIIFSYYWKMYRHFSVQRMRVILFDYPKWEERLRASSIICVLFYQHKPDRKTVCSNGNARTQHTCSRQHGYCYYCLQMSAVAFEWTYRGVFRFSNRNKSNTTFISKV